MKAFEENFFKFCLSLLSPQVDNGGQKLFVFSLKPFYQPLDSQELKPARSGIMFGNFAPHLPRFEKLPLATAAGTSKALEMTSEELVKFTKKKKTT